MNKNSHAVWHAAQEAAAILSQSGIHGVLVGTAALAALGKFEPAPSIDVDFFVQDIPDHPDIKLMERMPGTYKHQVAEWITGEVKVQFIQNDREEAARFLTRDPKIIDGVPVADLRDILGLKKWGNRAKDREFFDWFPEFAKLVQDVAPGDYKATINVIYN